MPLSANSLFWASIPLIIGAIIYQLDLLRSFGDFLPDVLALAPVRDLSTKTYCYASVKTLSDDVPRANCFTISNGKFSNVYLDDDEIANQKETGHVIPGLWDGHGHLYQYGESLHAVDLFPTRSMEEVHEKLVEYKQTYPEVGTSEQWLRGVGWDQANYGRWPAAVSCHPIYWDKILLTARSQILRSMISSRTSM